MKSFQESALSFRSKAQIGNVKTPVLIGICVLALIVLFLAGQSLWLGLSGSNFEVNKQEGDTSSEANPASATLETESTKTNSDAETQRELVYIHVSGAVVQPGVYEVDKDSRVQNAIDKAGGFREDAATEAINLARVISDGEQIRVPTLEELASGTLPPLQGSIAQSNSPAKININTASSSDLESLPGIGEVTAEKIVKERETNGAFSSPEDIMRVPGIGEKKYEALADLICV